ncbi:Serine/threonine-protein kinase PrkC [Aquisphaera giovannonii]|uniref:Serine/threonine-protein kinase PrkC n=1 Tax=Aquisphaera giovannonii TaxID=406548 RepID=A0A5B9VYM4_9BACT|nr:serine/threonine-protein kinase [Aquisphaera giovannonii]QEH33084.1 Serine/threonine-protein kinase PrkC [Aquisphaera giovannonii]
MRPAGSARPGRPDKVPEDSPPADLADYTCDASETLLYDSSGEDAGLPPDASPSPPAAFLDDPRQFAESVVGSGLVEESRLLELRAQLFPGDEPVVVSRLAGAMVRRGWLTPYQAAAIRQGKARGLAIGDYLVLDKIGAGGMGLVFRVRHPGTEADLALKLLSPSISRDRAAVARFRREVSAVARLSHPNIVAALDSGEARGLLYLVMEYVDGKDLARHVRDHGPMSVRQAVDCVIQAARGLKEAHDRGITHRDIKPANLLLDRSNVVKVLDLGLARVNQGLEAMDAEGSDTDLTVSGVIVGTVDYMSPEQAFDPRLADPRSDIYSLGCTLHYLLTGRAPYGGKSFMERMLGHRERPIPSLRNARDDVPVPLNEFFWRMMGKSVGVRPQSMVEVIDGLKRCAEAKPSHLPPSRPASPHAEDRFDPDSVYGLADQSVAESAHPVVGEGPTNVYTRPRNASDSRVQGRRARRRGHWRRILILAILAAIPLLVRLFATRRRSRQPNEPRPRPQGR